MTPGAEAAVLSGRKFNPYLLANNAAIYSLDGQESDSTYLTNGLGRLKLVADRSGNSAVNGLVLNGATGNYASSPDAVPLRVTGDIDLRADCAANDWNSVGDMGVLTKWGGVSNAYILAIVTSQIRLYVSVGGVTKSAVSTATVPFSAYSRGWIRATRASASGTVTFYTSTDGSNWTQLGNTVATTAGAIDAGTDALNVGRYLTSYFTGTVYRAQVLNGIGGTVAFDSNFTPQAKLVTSFTESSANAATVTVNASGDLGARICGARDIYQSSLLKQPAFAQAADGRNTATFDGSNDYMKAAPFPFSQPESVYFVGSQVSWTVNRAWQDGNAINTAIINQDTSTPNIRVYAGASLGLLSFPVGTRGVITQVLNGASSFLGLNKSGGVSGNAGTATMNGYALGASADGSTAVGNITFNEAILRAAADDTTTQLRIAQYEISRWGISA